MLAERLVVGRNASDTMGTHKPILETLTPDRAECVLLEAIQDKLYQCAGSSELDRA